MRILQLITDTDRRGAQLFAVDLGEAMRAEGHAVTTVALAPGQQGRRLDLESLGVSRRGVSTLWKLRKRMRNYDVTIAHGSTTLFATAVAGFPNRPFVYRQISDSRFWANSLRRRIRTAIFLRRATQIVALSDEARKTLMDHVWAPPHRIVIIPNGVSTTEFHTPTAEERQRSRRILGVSLDKFVVCYVGALVQEKGVDLLLEAVSQVPDVKLIVAGDGPERQRLEMQASQIAPDRVQFIGTVDRPFLVYAASDLLVLPSRGGDSMPASLIEAGLCGVPSAATAIGSIARVVIDKQTGFIIEPSKDAIVQKVLSLKDDQDLLKTLGERSRQHCLTSFEIKAIAKQWLEMIEGAFVHVNSEA